MIDAIFDAIGDSVTAFTANLGTAFSGITSMFYDPTANTGAGALTPLGIVTLITAGVALVVFAFTFIYKLIRRA